MSALYLHRPPAPEPADDPLPEPHEPADGEELPPHPNPVMAFSC